MKSADKEEIFALLNLLSDDDCPHPIWNDIANKIRMSKDEEVEEKIKKWVRLKNLIQNVRFVGLGIGLKEKGKMERQ